MVMTDQQIDGSVSALSSRLARFIAEQAGEPVQGLLARTVILLNEALQSGDSCLFLTEHAGDPLPADSDSDPALIAPPVDEWVLALSAHEACVGTPGTYCPLILDGQNLYLRRFWQDERRVVDGITQRLVQVENADVASLRELLQKVYAEDIGSGEVNWQMLASAQAASRRFAVISGGPGTGKTSTVVRVLLLLLMQQPDMRIGLAAPTGKAAARMMESIRARMQEMTVEEDIRRRMPDSAITLHRLLGSSSHRNTHWSGFRHHAGNPLPLDCLVIDEASMIDLGMMARLLDALPPTARLVLLGDRDQLASVDAGNVLGDITGQGRELTYSRQNAELLARLCDTEATLLPISGNTPAIADAIALLRKSYRFSDEGGVGRLARLVNSGDAEAALTLCRSEDGWLSMAVDKVEKTAMDWALDRYAAYLEADDVAEALQRFDRTRVLCALHEGELGDRRLNVRMEELLRNRGLVSGGPVFRGKPVMITVNDYELQLFNGDIGLIWPNETGVLRAWFIQADGTLRDVAVGSLPEHAPAWALTVHKSQGSEFDQVLLVLPSDADNALVSRELLYTGITRAREKVIVHSNEKAFLKACQRRMQRRSGLAPALGWQVQAPRPAI